MFFASAYSTYLFSLSRNAPSAVTGEGNLQAGHRLVRYDEVNYASQIVTEFLGRLLGFNVASVGATIRVFVGGHKTTTPKLPIQTAMMTQKKPRGCL
jgi:hypothetical protein